MSIKSIIFFTSLVLVLNSQSNRVYASDADYEPEGTNVEGGLGVEQSMREMGPIMTYEELTPKQENTPMPSEQAAPEANPNLGRSPSVEEEKVMTDTQALEEAESKLAEPATERSLEDDIRAEEIAKDAPLSPVESAKESGMSGTFMEKLEKLMGKTSAPIDQDTMEQMTP